MLGDDVVVSKGPGGTAPYDSSVATYRADGIQASSNLDAFPQFVGSGAKVGVADVDASMLAELLVGPGPSPAFPPRVRGFRSGGLRSMVSISSPTAAAGSG